MLASRPRSSTAIALRGAHRRPPGARLRARTLPRPTAEILAGALAPDNLPNTLNWAVPLVGMTLVAAIPLRGGMINLGGDGQMVIGGLVAALIPLYLPAPGPVLDDRRAHRRGACRRPLCRARRLGRGASRHPDADLEPAPQLSGDRPRLLHRRLSASRHHHRPRPDRDDPGRRAAAGDYRRRSMPASSSSRSSRRWSSSSTGGRSSGYELRMRGAERPLRRLWRRAARAPVDRR